MDRQVARIFLLHIVSTVTSNAKIPTRHKMEKSSVIKKRIEKSLANSASLDSIVTLLKSLLNLSVIGSPISMLLSDFIPTRRFLRLETFVEELSQEFKKVEDKVDIEYITTDEFAFLFEQCFKAASENYQKEKIDSFKAILVNATIDKSLIQLEKEFFLNLTKQLTVLHIQILNFLHDTRDYIKRKGLEENEIQGHYKDFIPLIFPDIEFDTVKIALDDLNKYGLTELKSSQFGVMTVSSGLKLLGDRRTTSFGDKYIKFITL